ncbi:MAG: BMC domain-containing protein [Rhodothermales bacterium]|nr:BMC domain-containing protein [Rhodothermales bacterium]
MIETRGLVAAVEAADAMLKAASVSLAGIERTQAALITVQITGETAAVRSSVDAGVAAAERVGHVVSSHVIPRPSDDVCAMQFEDTGETYQGSAPSFTGVTTVSSVDLERMTVRELRALARDTEDSPIQGRAIARATKQELLDALRTVI